VLKEDSRRSKRNMVPARIAKGRGDGFGLSMAEIARHVGVTTSGIAKAVARLEEEGRL
jgi:DNA-binding MarR family transcriptional regulator